MPRPAANAMTNRGMRPTRVQPELPAATRPAERHRAAANLLTALLAVVIAFLTLYPKIHPPGGLSFQDKVYHIIAFAALALPSATLYPRALRWSVPFGLAFGAAIEIIQPYVGRSGDVPDFLADAAGIAIGVTLGLTFYRSKLFRRGVHRHRPSNRRIF